VRRALEKNKSERTALHVSFRKVMPLSLDAGCHIFALPFLVILDSFAYLLSTQLFLHRREGLPGRLKMGKKKKREKMILGGKEKKKKKKATLVISLNTMFYLFPAVCVLSLQTKKRVMER